MTLVDAQSADRAAAGGVPPLVPLAPGWALWPVAMLRSAGYPATRLERFLDAAEHARADGDALHALLASVTSDDWVAEALVWQNPALHAWAERYRHDDGVGRHPPSWYRNRMRTVALYLQRYATKNETVGFFGPTGWAGVDPAADVTVSVAGTRGRVAQRTWFEPRALAALTRGWRERPEVRWQLPVRANHAALLRADGVERPLRGVVAVDDIERAVVVAATAGPVPPEQLLTLLPDRGQLARVLTRLHDAECVSWDFDLPVRVDLDARLAGQLAAFADPDLRAELDAELSALRALRDAVTAAAGEPTRVRDAVAGLGQRFASRTGDDQSRAKADDPDSRTPLVHDTSVDWDATVGARSLDVLRGPLELLLAVCRYATHRVAAGLDARVRARVTRGPVPFEDVLYAVLPALRAGLTGPLGREVVADVRAKVRALVAPAGPGPVALRSTDVRVAWLAAFAPDDGARGAAWPAAGVHSPDLMLAVDGDRHTWVLGEVHLASNPLDYRTAIELQPVPGRIEALVDAATPVVRHLPALPRTWARITPRTYPPPATHLPDKHRYWTLWRDTVLPHDVPVAPCLDLRVADTGSRAVVLDAAGTPVAPFVDFVGELLSIFFASGLSLFDEGEHDPRVVVDEVVLHRETWRLPADGFAAALAGRDRGAALRAVLDRIGAPRRCFVRVPGEPKPVFLDADRWILAESVARMIAGAAERTGSVVVTESLPAPEQAWLRTATGEAVTSEFRVVAQDLTVALPRRQEAADISATMSSRSSSGQDR